MDRQQPTIRLDKWLYFARFFKTRSLAARVVAAGHVRVNSQRVSKAAYAIGADDILTFAQAERIRVVRLLEVGTRRGPAPEAQALYEDLTPPEEREMPAQRVGERPTKRDRRAIDALRQDPGDD